MIEKLVIFLTTLGLWIVLDQEKMIKPGVFSIAQRQMKTKLISQRTLYAVSVDVQPVT